MQSTNLIINNVTVFITYLRYKYQQGEVNFIGRIMANNRRMLESSEIECAARAAHEVCRSFITFLGEELNYRPWDLCPEWAKESARASVVGIAEYDYTPHQLHNSWAEGKMANGWRFGKDKNFVCKTHPSLVTYDKLPEEQRIRDNMWVQSVRAVLDALWSIPQ